MLACVAESCCASLQSVRPVCSLNRNVSLAEYVNEFVTEPGLGEHTQPPLNCTYEDLVSLRKECSICSPDLTNASSIDGGVHDSKHIGPYTRWQGNLESHVVVVGQDFGDIASCRAYRGFPGNDVQTNSTLVDLFADNCISVSPPRDGSTHNQLFFTNAVLCMKGAQRDGRQQNVRSTHYHACRPFLRRTIELVNPRVVVTLGAHALKSVWLAFLPQPCPPLGQAVGKLVALYGKTQLLPVYHPSKTVQNTCRPYPQMTADWKPITLYDRALA